MPPQLGGELLQPRRMIDRRTDDGETDPTRRADVAVTPLAEMQREAEADFRLARRAALDIACRNFLRRGIRRAQRRRASLRRVVAVAQLEDSEEPIAHELERLA